MKLTATVKEACQMTGLGKTTLYDLMARGEIESTTVGRRRLVKVESLRKLVEAA
ncbi:MAG: helix-turn-helix domain-containing protein [Sphingomonas sp.]|nr:helix-turn-helix domain-containing protein [Sphingomonas sp.]